MNNLPRASTEARRRHTCNRKYFAAACITSAAAAASLYVRKWRDGKLHELQEAQTSGVFTATAEKSGISTTNTKNGNVGIHRDLNVLATTVARAGLMGTSVPGAKSVKHELDTIRKWHQDNGFTGGLVLRELTEPLFDATVDMDEDEIEGGDDVEPIPHHELWQRECYYLYYELRPNGEIRQQIFCRGTTLYADMRTCVNAKMVYDDELGCWLHAGFLSHADRLLRDVLPLLAPSSNRRATVEACGHSLGGAVALIVAMKLKKRGYNVRRVTSVAAPRFCGEADVDALQLLLPRDALRIEDDLDIVPFLPPHERGLGDKLWFANDGERDKAYYVPFRGRGKEDDWWLESVVINTRIPETLTHLNSTHRIPSYVAKIRSLAAQVEEEELLSESNNAEPLSTHSATKQG